MDAPGAYYTTTEAAPVPDSNNQIPSSLNDATKLRTNSKSLKIKPSLLTLCESPAVHDLNGANIRLEINNAIIKTHEHLISKCIRIKRLIEKARLANPQSETLPIVITGSGELVFDFLNTFKILNASSIEVSANFDLQTLVSAARIAAAFEHPALYSFCIKRLEGLSLNSMERLQVARALDLKSWEERAYQELSEREEMISKEEALALNIDAYWEVASTRERRQRGKPRDYTCEILFFCIVTLYTLVMVACGYLNPSI